PGQHRHHLDVRRHPRRLRLHCPPTQRPCKERALYSGLIDKPRWVVIAILFPEYVVIIAECSLSTPRCAEPEDGVAEAPRWEHLYGGYQVSVKDIRPGPDFHIRPQMQGYHSTVLGRIPKTGRTGRDHGENVAFGRQKQGQHDSEDSGFDANRLDAAPGCRQ
ncbi:hypothetical protein CSHISOI_11609, partial [Colletotrichum shisoi]